MEKDWFSVEPEISSQIELTLTIQLFKLMDEYDDKSLSLIMRTCSLDDFGRRHYSTTNRHPEDWAIRLKEIITNIGKDNYEASWRQNIMGYGEIPALDKGRRTLIIFFTKFMILWKFAKKHGIDLSPMICPEISQIKAFIKYVEPMDYHYSIIVNEESHEDLEKKYTVFKFLKDYIANMENSL